MSATFTWNIKNLYCIPAREGKQNIVYSIEWECHARQEVDGKVFVHHTPGTTSMDPPNSNTPFIEFKDVTEEDVYRWAAENGLNKQAVEERLLMLLDTIINPPIVSCMPPWLVTRI